MYECVNLVRLLLHLWLAPETANFQILAYIKKSGRLEQKPIIQSTHSCIILAEFLQCWHIQHIRAGSSQLCFEWGLHCCSLRNTIFKWFLCLPKDDEICIGRVSIQLVARSHLRNAPHTPMHQNTPLDRSVRESPTKRSCAHVCVCVCNLCLSVRFTDSFLLSIYTGRYSFSYSWGHKSFSKSLQHKATWILIDCLFDWWMDWRFIDIGWWVVWESIQRSLKRKCRSAPSHPLGRTNAIFQHDGKSWLDLDREFEKVPLLWRGLNPRCRTSTGID